ncbi:basement membrane-specific heparan sulfate proteoglycan core protein isoform X4 [Amyelois transitella]|uniref:basement membrane-specific heparan sulfate proteoglycan core protein isoform X4 n=1 Tax=Amyelois transitella TaxID=680683 RepID=UPI00298FDD14|nr:basement membrane-specific heparan sulfate proteoglycan core protein isoform X4 [Amyelois transitella]
MRTGGTFALLLLLLSILQISRTEDLYLEGEEDASNEFLEVKDTDSGLGGHLRRLKRQWFNFFDPFSSSSTTTESPDIEETATEDPDENDLKDDLEDHFGSGFPDKIEPDHKEKTLRVTFVVMEPYQHEYSNRDSPQFRNFSRTIADAVDQLYEPLGTRRTSLVRIQSRVSDEFSCKVTLDILTTGYEDINRLSDILREHIKNRRELASGTRRVTVSDADFSANIIDPDTPLGPCADDEVACDLDRCFPASSRCNGIRECLDGTDELNCYSEPNSESTTPPTTESEYYNPQCSNPIPCKNSVTSYCPEQTCDGYNDCPEFDDELNCGFGSHLPDSEAGPVKPSAPSTEPPLPCDFPIQCQDSDIKYCPNQRCNGNFDCPYQDDEDNCLEDVDQDQSLDSTSDIPPFSGPLKPQCPNPIPCQDSTVTYCPEQRCNSYYDCPNQDDEFGCNSPDSYPFPTPATFEPQPPPTTVAPSLPCDFPIQCQDSEVKYCPNQRCDGVPDCPNQDDESSCTETDQTIRCPPGEFQCDKTRCLMESQRCDGVSDCYDQTDEANCKSPGTDDFRCDDGRSIEAARKCDGVSDCSNGEDEANCDCLSNEFQCESDRTCIERRKKCDGFQDCNDGSDEQGCEEQDHEGQFLCENKIQYIPESQRCDKFYDCDDFSDEKNCPCGDNDFKCNNGFCIHARKRCDGTHDCQDGSDEHNCENGSNSVACMPNKFQCANGECVAADAKCNGISECSDDSDESDCNCKRDEFHCQNIDMCISFDKRCNGEIDCDDGEDEFNCVASCPDGHISCAFDITNVQICAKQCDGKTDCLNGEDERNCPDEDCHFCDNKCLESWRICDGIPDCSDDSDEEDCALCNGPEDFRCDNGECINRNLKCNNIPECSDSSDEFNCKNITSPDSGGDCYDQFTCRDGACINKDFFCDGHQDCRDNSDEENCPCKENDFQCRSGQCLPDIVLCDGYPHCDDGSDEYNCASRVDTTVPPFITTQRPINEDVTKSPFGYPNTYDYKESSGCGRSQWRCDNGKCIDGHRRCDGNLDCSNMDTSDEFNCPPGSPEALNLKTYPDQQTVTYSNNYHVGDVVFDCRDEGPRRAKVTWIRGDGKRMKSDFEVKDGRLILNNVTTADSGTYICQAKDYVRSPGAQKTAYLNVEKLATSTRNRIPNCGPHEATCSNLKCIPKSAICDGKQDCGDGSDEHSCGSPQSGSCQPNQFRCANNRCILKTWVCDSENDCDDFSDEDPLQCGAQNATLGCSAVEFPCQSGGFCIPRSYHCDGLADCKDGSDENCAPIAIVQPPRPPTVRIFVGDVLTLTCKAVGIPIPLISWRLNWGHVPPQCTSTSENGFGQLTCPNMRVEHSGAYSCEALNNKGASFAVPDSIVIVENPDTQVCPSGQFNSEAHDSSECISCFCFGKSTQCKSADLFVYDMAQPLGQGGTRLVGVKLEAEGPQIDTQSITNEYYYQPRRNGASVTKLSYGSRGRSLAYPYLTLPASYTGNQLTSYGGDIKYSLSSQSTYPSARYDNNMPDVIIMGKYETLVYTQFGDKSTIQAKLVPGSWQKYAQGRLTQASREDIMMALDNVENILLRAELNGAGVDITDFLMQSAHHIDAGLGPANLVEECTCPDGYTGLSCQNCASGYERDSSGPWLGHCRPQRKQCPPGTFGDPNAGYACSPCPCPLTSSPNQFASTCYLGPSGVVCDCQPGYEGNNCERCAEGYEGNPLLPGDSCRPVRKSPCDPTGTSQVLLLDRCDCKDNVQGQYCDQCKPGFYYLSPDFTHGCAACFCSGVTQKCASSNLRRKTTHAVFNTESSIRQLGVYSSTSSRSGYNAPAPASVQPVLDSGAARADIDSRSDDAYYWSLPASFAGDKVTSYGGNLYYTLVNIPYGYNSGNNAADVQLISDNSLTFHHVINARPSNSGILNVTVPIFEKNWMRVDGKEVPREQFLLALADVKTILIKARYDRGNQLASLSRASIETAEPGGSGPVALHVEQCVCPKEYIGTSCEDCAPGYKRYPQGLYLENCGPCECNGHSKMCDPDTGVCMNCGDNTAGDYCEECLPGYVRDTYGNCVSLNPYQCTCDPRGVTIPCEDLGYCQCKQNVEGYSCDRCRAGTFGLSLDNPDGCLTCYCSGVTTECHETSNYKRIPMAAPIFGDNYGGYSITNLNGNNVLASSFVPMPDASELMYTFPFPPNEELFWSLPVFPGNRVLSYGGFLEFEQRYEDHSPGAVSDTHRHVILIGDDTSVYWDSPSPIHSGQKLQVPLREGEWLLLNSATPASRNDMMNVLKSLRRVLVKATLTQDLLSTSIADVSMDTATTISGSEYPSVKGIEVCMCPPGYSGTSCETCISGYYKDERGLCQECSCNGHECELSMDNQVVCLCRPPYTGTTCSTFGLSMELQPTLEEDPDDGPLFRKITLTCKYAAHEPLTIRFYSEGNEVGFPKWYNESVFDKDGWRGEHVWHTVWDTRTDTVYECHTITKKGATMGVLTTSMPDSGDSANQEKNATLPPPPIPTIVVTINQPIVIKEIGGSVTFNCHARSRMVNGNLPVRWSKAGGYLPRNRAIVDENSGTLIIMQLQKTDTGKYICQTTDGQSTNQAVATLTVGDNLRRAPEVSIEPAVNEYNEGDRIELVCRASGNPEPTISWRRADARKPLPNSATIYGGALIIEEAVEDDSGDYRCIASNSEGSSDRIALIVVRPRPHTPQQRDRLTVSNTTPMVNEGNSTSVTCTGTPGIPAGTIQWVRQDRTDLQYNVRSENGVLYIENAQPDNQGVYVCQTLYSRVNPVVITLHVIPIVSPPEDEPNITLSVSSLRIPTGGSGSVDCIPSGYPLPVVKWTRNGGQFGPGTSQRGNTLMITNAQNDDQDYYQCEAILNGEPRSNIYIYIEIEKREVPQVRIYPEDPQPVTIGDSYELHCRVLAGVPEPDVTWESSRPMTPNAQILPNNILKFENIDVNDEGSYTCTASNIAGKANATAFVKVQSYPVISMTPSNQILAQLGDAINFQCRASGVPLPFVSIKYENGNEIVPPTPGSAWLRIQSASERDAGAYRCVASSSAGTLDEPFIIDLNRENPEYDPGFNPDYDPYNPGTNTDTQLTPSNRIVLIQGKENVLRCDADGYDARWTRGDRQPLQSGVQPYNEQLIFLDTLKADSGEYECMLYDPRTREPVNAITYRVEVLSPPRITIQPPTQTVHPGQSTNVDCIVDGDLIENVTWLLGRQSSRIEVQNSRLIFHQIEVDDAGDYVCTARNPVAEANGTAKVIVTDDTRDPKKSKNREQRAMVNSKVHMNCSTKQRHTIKEWTKDGRPLPPRYRIRGDGSLFIKSAKLSDSGRYTCIIRDAYGQQTTEHIDLYVSGTPITAALVTIDQPRRQYRVGENVEVTCVKASRDTTANWEKYGTREFVETREYNEGVVLVINGVEESDAGVYRCTGKDRYGYTSFEDFDLEVQPSQQPPSYPMSNQHVHVAHAGQTVDMPCRHDLEPPVYIEWRKEFSSPLPSYVRQNEPILTLRNISEADAGTYVCRVSNQRVALEARSTLRVTGLVPNFDGNSWLAIPTIKDAYRQFDVEIAFKPLTADGIILYNNQRPDGSGDYLALQLANGIPVFTMETGSSVPLVVQGDRPLQLNVWHTIRLSRVNSKVSMYVDENGPFVSELRTPWEVLDLSDPMYVGAAPEYVQLPSTLNTTYGFVGCISMLVLSKRDVNLIPDSVDSRNVGECDTCTPNWCLNEGVCQEARNERGYICLCAQGFAGMNCNRTGEACRPGICGPGKCTDTDDGYTCSCPVTYTGKNCDVKQYIEYPAFTGSAYLAIKVPTTSRVLKVAMNVKATAPVSDGIIMYWAESAKGTGGFTALTVRNGRLEFTYDLGDGYPVVITANRTLQANEWTDVRIARFGTVVSLTVNQVHTYEGRLVSPTKELTLDTPMFVGGVDDSIVLNNNLGVTEGFNGCIKDLSVFNDPVNIINSSIQSANIKECSTYDRGDIPEIESVCSQCRNGGACEPDSSVCSCPPGFSGTYCENRASENFARVPRSPCADSPCRNGGTCKGDQNSRMKYACDCPLGYSGANCQMPLQLLQSVAFNGNGYIELPANLISYEQLDVDPAVIALAMHTNADGVLLYQREALMPAGYGDYVLIRVENGVVVIEWDMGGGSSSLSISDVYVADGERHSIIVKILPEGEVSLTVDTVTRNAATDSLQKTMNADSNIYVGGMPESLNVNRFPGLTGCIEQVELMNSARGIRLGDVAVAARNTQICREY